VFRKSVSPEHDLQRQEDFVKLASNLHARDVLTLPDFSEYLNKEGGETTGIIDTLYGWKNPHNTIYVSEELRDQMESNGGSPNALEFSPQEMLRMGRENSWHGVFFGSLTSKWFKNGVERKDQIAIKPVTTDSLRQAKILHEVAMYQYLGRVGLATFQVMGLTMFDTPQNSVIGHVITKFDPRVKTMDNLPWANMEENDKWEAVDLVLRGLANLHSKMIFHGEPEFKNTALTESPDSLFYVDLERGSCLSQRHKDIHAIKLNMNVDLSRVTRSVEASILQYMPEKLTNRQRFGLLHNKVFERYFEHIVRADNEYTGVLAQAYARMIKEKVDQL
jgi:hypothetical protein